MNELCWKILFNVCTYCFTKDSFILEGVKGSPLVELNGPAIPPRAWAAEAATPVKRPAVETEEAPGESNKLVHSSSPESPDLIPKTPTHVRQRFPNFQVGTFLGTVR